MLSFPFDMPGGTVVSVGNGHEPFSRLLDEAGRLAGLGLLPRPVLVQHGYTPFASSSCRCVPQLELAAFEEAIGKANVVIIHAGAGSVLTALRLGKRPIVMARRAEHGEILDGHQVEFLEQMAARGLVHRVHNACELLEKVRLVMSQPSGRETAPFVNVRLQEAVASALRSAAEGRYPTLVRTVWNTLARSN